MKTHETPSLAEWLRSPLGAYTLQREREWLDATTPDIFGYHAIQLGLPEFDLLRESRITHLHRVSPEASGSTATVRAHYHELPFDEHSIDLCLLPHTLEFDANPHLVLREVDRVMRPEGRILIVGFNPWSLYGVRRGWSSTGAPWSGQFVSLVRMKDWLQLLSFEPAGGRLACYIPPFSNEKWQRRLGFLDNIGDRWWGVAGGVYMLEAVKRVQGMRLIAPKWSDRVKQERKYAAAANRAGGHLRVVK
jgi:SAM-dependent methyltransferase